MKRYFVVILASAVLLLFCLATIRGGAAQAAPKAGSLPNGMLEKSQSALQVEAPGTQPAPASPAITQQQTILNASGKLTYLRVHDVGSGYGGPGDSIDVEVVVQFDSAPGKAMGFQLRNDANQVARQGMLDLLRDAFSHNWTTTIDYLGDPAKNTGVIFRVWLTK
ncbi:MAG: hypothetical protein HY326_09985 [Chloroflexi bacterium]|nr:hypothetical protein [Chloroflexota bacterium]